MCFRTKCSTAVKCTTQTTGKKRHLGYNNDFLCLAIRKSLPIGTEVSYLRELIVKAAVSPWFSED